VKLLDKKRMIELVLAAKRGDEDWRSKADDWILEAKERYRETFESLEREWIEWIGRWCSGCGMPSTHPRYQVRFLAMNKFLLPRRNLRKLGSLRTDKVRRALPILPGNRKCPREKGEP
jgi:hypothetical protein